MSTIVKSNTGVNETYDEKLDVADAFGLEIGDMVTTLQPKEEPSWLPCTGVGYNGTTYPDLLDKLGKYGFPREEADIFNFSPGAALQSLTITADGIYLATTSTDAAHYIEVYKWDDNEFILLSDALSHTPASGCYTSSFSPDGAYLAIGSISDPRLMIFKRSGDVFTKLTDPTTMPASYAKELNFSPCGTFLAMTATATPYIYIYKRVGDVFTLLSQPNTAPTAYGQSCEFSPDGNYLVTTQNGTASMNVYKISGDTFTKLAEPAIQPLDTVGAAGFSQDSSLFVAIHMYDTPFMTVYSVDSGTDDFVKLDTPDSFPTDVGATGGSVTFSYDDKYLILGFDHIPYVMRYRREGNTLIEEPLIDETYTMSIYGMLFTPDDKYLINAQSGYPYARALGPSEVRTPKLGNPATGVVTYIKTGL